MGTTEAEAEDEADLGLLARQTLSGVAINELPPEPLALGVDLGRLATTSQPPAAPRRTDDTDGRIDLRPSSPGALPAPAKPSTPSSSTVPAANGAAALAARLRAQRGGRAVGASQPPLPVVARAVQPPPVAQVDSELDVSTESRAFSAAAAFASSLTTTLELVRRAPSWTWVLASGVAIGLVLGLALGGGDDAPAPAEVAAAPQTQAPSNGVPVLPPGVVGSRGALPPQVSLSAMRGRPGASGDRGNRRVSGPSSVREPQASVATVPAPQPAPGESRSIDTLLDQAIGGTAPQPSPEPAARAERPADASLPPTPARADVARLLSEVLPRVRFCSGGRGGVATAQIVAKSSGRIASVKIIGAPYSRTTAARCMETAIRGVAFPPFRQSTFRVTYPYAL